MCSKSLEQLARLARGDVIIYEIIQLWNYRDKLKADCIEQAIFEGVELACHDAGLALDAYPVFMPFRDSDEEDITAADKGHLIFDADMERIDRDTFAMVGFSDGLAKDGGAFFEYGRAAALGIPTVLFVSDFPYFANRYKDWPGASREGIVYPVDPVVMAGIGEVIVKCDLPLEGADAIPTSRDIAAQLRKKEQFRRRLGCGFDGLLRVVRDTVRSVCVRPYDYVKHLACEELGHRQPYVYLEFEGICEWQIAKMAEIAKGLEEKGIAVATPVRFSRTHQEDFISRHGVGAMKALGAWDLHVAMRASTVVTCGEGWDVPVGPAFVQGVASARHIPCLLYYSANRQLNAKGGTETLVNLMLEYSATKVVSSTQEMMDSVESIWSRQCEN